MTTTASNGQDQKHVVKRRGLTKAIYSEMASHPGVVYTAETLVDALPARWLAGDDHHKFTVGLSALLSPMIGKYEGVVRVGHGAYRYDGPLLAPLNPERHVEPTPAPPASVVQPELPTTIKSQTTEEDLVLVKILARLDDGTLIVRDVDGTGVWKATPV